MSPSDIAGELNIPHFEDLIDTFLQHQLESQPFKHLDLNSNITIYTSAIAVFCAPSDICSIHGMAKEWIHARPRWGKFWVPHYDTTYVVTNPNVSSMGGLNITWVKLFLSFTHHNRTYPCALIHWFSKNTMVHAAHLIGESNGPLSILITYISALDMFDTFHVNKYLDQHVYKIAF